MLPGVKHVPFGDLGAVEKAINAKTCAVFVEPVQGEAGVRVPTATFISKLAKLCTSKKVLLVFDEVQSGFGRTGKLFAYEHYKVKPDIITMAKRGRQRVAYGCHVLPSLMLRNLWVQGRTRQLSGVTLWYVPGRTPRWKSSPKRSLLEECSGSGPLCDDQAKWYEKQRLLHQGSERYGPDDRAGAEQSVQGDC